MEIRSGKQTSFWFDKWCPLGRLYDITRGRGFIALGISSSATVASALSSHRRRHHRADLLNNIETELEKIRSRGHNRERDVALWRHSNNKYKPQFSTSETWLQIREAKPTVSWSKAIWFSDSIPKYSFMLWLAAKNRIMTGDRMVMWNRGVNTSCGFCSTPMETMDHLFFECPYSSRLWGALSRKLLRNHYSTRFTQILTLLSTCTIKGTTRFILKLVFQATVHTLWIERNMRRQGDQPRPAEQLIQFLDRLVRNKLSSIQLLNANKMKDGLQIWFDSRS